MIRVAIVDDSATMRMALTRILESDGDLQVVGSFGEPYLALSRIVELAPDVVTADVDMPGMDGIAFVRALHKLIACPVVMVSAFTTRDSQTTFEALDAGAVDFIAKPKDIAQLDTLADELPYKLRIAARTRGQAPSAFEVTTGLSSGLARSVDRIATPSGEGIRLVAIGGSTGAPQILPELLARLGPTSAPVVVAIHMPAGFTRSYADRLQTLLPDVTVAEARHGQTLGHGQVVMAPGDFHMRIGRSGKSLRLILDQNEPVKRHRPSIDLLFESCARAMGRSALGVLLTGMGQDGASGLLQMKQSGATTLVQEPTSCLVDGMPQAAISNCAASEVLGPRRIAARLGIASRLTS